MSPETTNRLRAASWVALLLLSIAAFPLFARLSLLPGDVAEVARFGALAVFFGELVGFSEVITRYRDEPIRATCNQYGSTYLLINGALSGAAFFLMKRYADRVFPLAADRPFLQAVAAGFGAMAVFRSKLFVFHTDDGKDVPIGPDVVIGSVLRIVDRKIDRMRASSRQQLVFDLAKRITAAAGGNLDFEKPNNFVSISLASFQNLSTEEKQQILAKSDELREKLKDAPTLLKAMVLGFMVLDIAGEENFRAIMVDLEAYLKSSRPP